VITGFRLGLGGAAASFDVYPDLAVYGKAIAGGWPVAALVGRSDLMDLLGGPVNHSGTFNGSVMACAATIATLGLISNDPPYERMVGYGTALMEGLKAVGDEASVPLHIEGLPMAFYVAPLPAPDGPAGGPASLRLSRHLADFGVWTTTRGLWFVSAVHGDAELNWTLDRFTKALGAGLSSGALVP
jgi:glutamate-1-semialdehyde 2,1-aminomutase